MKAARAMLSADTLLAVRESLRVSLAEVPKYTTTVKNRVVVKLNNANDYYKNITGIDELDRCQSLVTSLQGKLLDAQEKRRQIGVELTAVRKKSNEIQDMLHKVKRQENLQRFLDLMKDETELLKREQTVTRAFQEQDRAEREIFSAFTNAIRDSHERQRTHLERTKYWGMILSIVGSFVSFSLSSLRTEDLKKTIATHMRTNYEPVVAKLEENERIIQVTMNGIQVENTRLLDVLNSQLNEPSIEDLKVLKVVNVVPKSPEDDTKDVDVEEDSGVRMVQRVVTYSILAAIGICIVKLLGD